MLGAYVRCSYLHVRGKALKRDGSGRWSNVKEPPAEIRAAPYWARAEKEAASKAQVTIAAPMLLCPSVTYGSCRRAHRYIRLSLLGPLRC
jgi:hypothetical protein